MIVEVVGCTGAGKSTLISLVRRRLAEEVQVITIFELIANPVGLSGVSNRSLRNVIQDIAGIPFFIGSLFRHRMFVKFVIDALIRNRNRTLFTLNYVRSIVRKIGMYEIANLYNRGRVVIVDEGTVMSAHLLFVFTETRYSPQEIIQFSELVPLPEVIVYVTASAEELVGRTLQRDDAPREMHDQPHSMIDRYVRRAADVFAQLVAADRIQARVLTVVNDKAMASDLNTIADHVAECILDRLSGNTLSSAMQGEPSERSPKLKETHAS